MSASSIYITFLRGWLQLWEIRGREEKVLQNFIGEATVEKVTNYFCNAIICVSI